MTPTEITEDTEEGFNAETRRVRSSGVLFCTKTKTVLRFSVVSAPPRYMPFSVISVISVAPVVSVSVNSVPSASS